jgi:hypothetical protein
MADHVQFDAVSHFCRALLFRLLQIIVTDNHYSSGYGLFNPPLALALGCRDNTNLFGVPACTGSRGSNSGSYFIKILSYHTDKLSKDEFPGETFLCKKVSPVPALNRPEGSRKSGR